MDGSGSSSLKLATFGAGCFWSPEVAFRRLKGVKDAVVGYAGGQTRNPTYREVCSGSSGHAEVVQVTYDPKEVSYEALLDVFWGSHDPTQVNRQGPDVGSQYRTVIFTHDAEQAEVARKSRMAQEASGRHRRAIATQIEPAQDFWPAEDYHQRYLEKRGLASCHVA